MKRFLLTLLVVIATAVGASAQVTVPNTLADGETIDAARLNQNFSTIYGDAFNRTGGSMTGDATMRNIFAVANDTYDIGTTGSRFQDAFFSGTLTVQTTTVATNTSIGGTLGVTGATTLSSTLDVASSLNIGSGNVDLVGTDGRINGPLSSTIIDDLSGVNLTGVAKLASSNTFSANNSFLTYDETDTSPTISGGTLTLDLANSSHFTVALNANVTTLAVSNVPSSSRVASFVLAFTMDGTPRTVDWTDIGVRWAAGVAPTLSSTNNKVDIFTFISYDGGSTWFGFTGGQLF